MCIITNTENGYCRKVENMKQLIITADDYGMSMAVNQAIQEGIDNGIITSTNVMMNMPFCDDKDRIINKAASIGLHWNLTCGEPVLPASQIPSLVNKEGSFFSIVEFRQKFKEGSISVDEIKKELIAQYEKYKDIWGEPSYWNSHENVHLWPKTHEAFIQTAAYLGINKMRSHDRIYVPPKSKKASFSLSWRIKEPIKKMVFSYWKREALQHGMHSPDGKICCLDETDVHDLEYTFSNIQWKKNTVAEFTCHPATKCDSHFFGNMTDNRIIEYQLVTGREIHKYIEKGNIELVNFDAVL